MARRSGANSVCLILTLVAAYVLAATNAQCICTALYDPVCSTKTGQTYPNKCTALCDGLTAGQIKPGECTDLCICPLYLTPICDTHGRSRGNPCLARCGGIQAGAWRPGPCDSPKRYVGGVEDVTANCGDQVQCLLDPCAAPWSATCSNPLPTGAVCLSNYCPHLTLPGGQQPGPCSAVWIDPATGKLVPCVSGATALAAASSSSAAAPCICPLDRNPVCVNGLSYPSLCMAKCAGVVAKDATSGWKLGVCAPHNPFPTCPGNPATLPPVRCLAPCSRPCTAVPSAICVPNPCGTLLTYRGYKVGACGEVWIDAKGAVVDACMPQPADVDIYSCNADSPRYMCNLDSYNACDTATCPGAPSSAKCLVKACDLTYRGQLLSACTAIFYDPSSGDVYDCGSKVSRRLLHAQQ